MTHEEFSASLKFWLGCEALPADVWCPKCDQVLDAGSVRALACMCGGDAVRTHNELGDDVFFGAQASGMNPDRETSRLLPSDPRRRPGDVSFAVWPGGIPVAMDFAVTSPLQAVVWTISSLCVSAV